MKIFSVSCFVLTRLALTSAWILYEKPLSRLSTPILFRRHVSHMAPLNLPEGQIMGKEKVGKLIPLNERPRLCILKRTCNQLYYRNRSQFKTLFEATPTFRNNYDNLYPRNLKGRQAPLQPKEGFLAGNSLVYMSPNLMIVRPVSAAQDWVPSQRTAYSGLREILFTKPLQMQEPRPERLINKDQGLLREFSEKPSTSKEEASAENMGAFTEASPQGAKTNSTTESSLHELEPKSIQQYAVKEVVDENQPTVGDGTNGMQGKPFFTSNIKDEMGTEVRRRTNQNSRIVKIIPLTEGEKTVKKQNTISNSYTSTTDHFLRIIPSQNSQGLIQYPKERPVNRKEQSKDLKIAAARPQNPTTTAADHLSRNRTNPISTSGIKNRENLRAIEITPSNGIVIPRQSTTAGTNRVSLANLDEVRGDIEKSSPFPVTEREIIAFKPQHKPSPKGEKLIPAPSKTVPTPTEVTFTVHDVENITHVPEEFTVTWKLENNPSPIGEVLNTIDYVSSENLTTPEGFTGDPSSLDLLKQRAEVKKDRESLWKNSRKMHFGQDSRPNELSDPVDQRRSDILISDNFDDYFDEEYNLNYLEKLKRNNSLEALKNMTSESLIPLIPMVIQDLRQGKIPSEDSSVLSAAFGDLWSTVLKLSNTTNMDMLPILKMKDESDLKNVLQSIKPQSDEPTTTETTISADYDSYDYMDKFKDLYEDLLTVGQELEGDEEKKLEKRVKGWKR